MSTIINLSFIQLFLINLCFTLLLLRGIYYRHSSNRETLFGLMMFAMGVFLVTFFLHNIDMSMGFAFGLFAVFSMLRYRTEALNLRDMTYLFLVIVMSLMTAVSKLPPLDLIGLDLIICGLAALGETKWLAARVCEKAIYYENINNIKPENHQHLLADLAERTGLDIIRVEIGEIDFLKDAAKLTVFYHNELAIEQPTESADLTLVNSSSVIS
ncbi:MAG: DUF4956 domain-containing protein [Gammaproteobacteria bacterium]|nr:DUF4956 domain-containing protein [Gammaproteobacteria bacterium]